MFVFPLLSPEFLDDAGSIPGWMLHLATALPCFTSCSGPGCIPGVPTGSPPISQHYSLISFSQTQKMGTFTRTSLHYMKNVDKT